ncbi:MAG: class I SAM-dependent methyltransferase, partial [Bifidobacteriaceae bacterium]|nr:class I SAM-dependent methyltransferase [Bifidobacteriaceae bacterium]
MEGQEGLPEQAVQSTMLLALYGRAKASRAFPEVMHDDAAVQLVAHMDYDFSQIDRSYASEYTSLCCLVRAKRLDERCAAYVSEHPQGAAVNLGAGLDTTLNRIGGGSVRRYNVDLPDAMAFRQRFIAPDEGSTDIAKSVFDYSWLDQVDSPDGSVFVLA